jgi:SAM-dependent methyltransferase
MAETVQSRIASFYDGLVERYGHDPRACDYGSVDSQRAKFQVLSQVRPMDGLTLLDVGCGFADYASFLEDRVEELTYVGVDLSPRMVSAARVLHPDLDIRQVDILDQPLEREYDVVNANGIFYLLGAGAEERMRRLVSRMFALARRSVAFNSLSAWASAHEPGEFYADPLETLRFCRTLTPWVTLRHDYLAHDFTIYLHRERVG